MEKKKYGKNALHVSRLGFGAWPLGNTAHGHTMTVEEGVELVQHALKQGINFFDTAPNYAFGKSEAILGEALLGKRHQVVINSKFGHHPDGTIDFSEDRLQRSIQGSLKRLKTDYLDSVILHNPAMDILTGKTNHFEHLKQLKAAGVILGFGVSIDTAEELKVVLTKQRVDVIELLYHVFAQSTRDLLDEIKKQNIALIIKVPLDSGWLTGKYTKDTMFSGIKGRWTAKDKLRRHQLVESVKNMVKDDALTKYALGFLWSLDAVTTVIPGIRTKTQLDEHVEALHFAFPKTYKALFEKLYDDYIAKDPLPW